MYNQMNTQCGCGRCGFHFHFDDPRDNGIYKGISWVFLVFLLFVVIVAASGSKSNEGCISPDYVLGPGEHYTVQCINTPDGKPN